MKLFPFMLRVIPYIRKRLERKISEEKIELIRKESKNFTTIIGTLALCLLLIWDSNRNYLHSNTRLFLWNLLYCYIYNEWHLVKYYHRFSSQK